VKRYGYAIALLLLVATIGSCRPLGYYGQAVTGHLSLLAQRRPIEQLLAGEDTLEPGTRKALERAVAAREFAASQLDLDASGSYRHYVALDRPHVVWNVFAAPLDSLELKQWCFPVAGCVGYRGYFSEQAARREADRLAAQGYDVYTGGVGAYSTLGWFNDPLTTPMLQRPAWALVALIFHELAHQRVYVPGDTVFNESYATFVEREGLRRWHESGRGEARELVEWRAARRRQAGFVRLVEHHADALRTLYSEVEDREALREARQAIQQALRDDYAEMRSCWGVDAYGTWFSGPLNNAQLATVGAYNRWVPAFARLMEASGHEWSAFHEAVEALATLNRAEREEQLEQWLAQAADDPAVSSLPATRCGPALS